MRSTLLLTALLAAMNLSAMARESLTIPVVSVELLFGGEGKITVDGKVTKLSGEQAMKLKADLATLHVDEMRRDFSKLQDLEAAATKGSREAVTRGRAVEREQDRVADEQRLITTLEKRQKDVQDELNEATTRNYNVNFDNLRSKLNAINSSLASERKELERARERLVLAEKRKVENEKSLNTATVDAAALRKELTERVEKVRAVLKAAGVG